MVDKPLNLLLLEDNLSDAELILYELRRVGFDVQCQRVENEADFLNALDPSLDLILADYNLPQFNGLRALDLLIERELDVPFILVSGRIGEEKAVDAIRRGAVDYLLKDRLARLGQAVENALEYKRLRLETQRTSSQLRDREESYADLLKNLNGMVYRLVNDPPWTIEYLSDGCYHLTGYHPQELAGGQAGPLTGLMLAEDRTAAIEKCRAELSLHKGYSLEYRILLRNGDARWMWDRAKAIYSDAGQLLAIEGLIVDIDERKQTEERANIQLRRLTALHAIDMAITSLGDLQHTLQVLLEQATVQLSLDAASLLLLDPDSRMLTYYAGYGFHTCAIAQRTFPLNHPLAGIHADVAASRRLIDLPLPPGAPDPNHLGVLQSEGFVACAVVPLIAQERTIGVLEVFRRTPGPSDEEWWAFLETLAGQAAIAAENARLSLETRGLLEQTQAQAQRTQQIIDSSPDGMLVLDGEDRLMLANPSARLYVPSLHALEIGDPMTALNTPPLIDFLQTNRSTDAWHELAWGDPIRLYEVATQQLIRHQKIEGRLLVMRDVTLDRQNQRLQQLNERLATVGQLAAGIAHDFNNIIGAIVLFSGLLSQTAQLSPKHKRYLDEIQRQSHHAADLVRQILDFSRASSVQRIVVDFGLLVKELVRLLERTLPESIHLRLLHDRNEYLIKGDATRLQQMLMNLALNARDAMPQGGELRLSLTAFTLTPDHSPPMPDMTAGDWLELEVSDTGHGIDPQHLSHIFEPFFTTKQPGKGSGLGLAQVYGIIKQHDGSLNVESNLGGGTVFHIYLPLCNDSLKESRPVDTGEIAPGTGETFLLVEDNTAVRSAIEESASELGFQVLSAGDGVEALEILAGRTHRISFVLCDLVMPRMGGVELAKQIRRLFPAVKVLVMSGHPLGESQQDLLDAGIHGWVQKPFSIHELARQIQVTLQ